MAHIMQPMSNFWNLQWSVKLLATIQTVQQILTWIAYPTRYIDECQDILLQVAITKQTIHCLDIDIDTLITELIAATSRNDKCIIVQVCTHQSISNIEQTLSCLLTLLGKSSSLWNKTIVKTIRQNEVNWFVQQLFALIGSNVAHCCKTVHILSSLFLN